MRQGHRRIRDRIVVFGYRNRHLGNYFLRTSIPEGIVYCVTSKKESPVRWPGSWVTIIRMNQTPFPKPPPADPLPLEVWLKRTDRAESGREAFFRGREAEYEVFRSAVTSLGEGIVGGGTMIFQGAPGAGKSALMGECMEAVRCHSTPKAPWVAVSINPVSLQSPAYVCRSHG